MRSWQFGVVAFLLALVVLMHALPIVAPDRTAPSWEYRIEGIEDEHFLSEMNRIGNAGWDVVSIRRANASTGYGAEPKFISEVVFKRAR